MGGPCVSNHSRLGCVETFLTCFDFTTEVGPAPPAPPPSPPPPPPLGPCHAISPMATDAWCQANCHYVGSSCPTDLCECDSGMMDASAAQTACEDRSTDDIVSFEASCLDWQRQVPEKTLPWEPGWVQGNMTAAIACGQLDLEGGGWRLPTRAELGSI